MFPGSDPAPIDLGEEDSIVELPASLLWRLWFPEPP
jgi:hypothetical protein